MSIQNIVHFKDCGDGTIFDQVTNLFFPKNLTFKSCKWGKAKKAAESLDLCGYKWRLPTIDELCNFYYRRGMSHTSLKLL